MSEPIIAVEVLRELHLRWAERDDTPYVAPEDCKTCRYILGLQ